MINLLRALVADQSENVIPGGGSDEFIAIDGSKFTAIDLPRHNPNLFAIAFLKKLTGPDFSRVIIDPQVPTQGKLVLSDEHKQLLKNALAANFKLFIFSKIRKSVNQAARDAKNKHKNTSQ